MVVLLGAQQQKGPVRPGQGGIQKGGEIQVGPDGARPPQKRPPGAGDGVRAGGVSLAGEEGGVDPVGQQGDVGAAGGEAVPQLGRGGEDHVGRLGQAALPDGGEALPLPVTVIDQTVIAQVIQQMDVLRAGGPQQGGAEAVPGGPAGDKAAQPPPLQLKQGGAALRNRQQGRKGVGGHIGTHLAAVLARAPAGGRKI